MAPRECYTLCDGVSLSGNQVSELIDESKPWKERKPIGFRFNPSDQSLAKICVDKFLDKDNFVLLFFKDINVYDYEPSELLGYAHEFGEKKMYFFTHLKYKHQTSHRSTGRIMFDRTARDGYWQINGKISFINIDAEDNSEKLIVRKTPLAFHKKEKTSGKEESTSWQMEEFVLRHKQSYANGKNSGEKSDVLALCVIYSGKQRIPNCVSENKSCDKRREPNSMPYMEGESSQNLATEASSSLYDYPSKRHCVFSISTPEIYYDFSPTDTELLVDCFQSGNEHGSNQQQHPNSYGSSDLILHQQNIESEMGRYLSQQNPAGITPVAAQPPFNHNSYLENIPTARASDSNRNDPAATAMGFEQWSSFSCFDQNLSPGPNELTFYGHEGHQYTFNELASNEQEQPNSYFPIDQIIQQQPNSSVPSDQIIQQQPSDPLTICYRPCQPLDRHLNFDEYVLNGGN